jgi:histidine triad (HIT) family protein
MHYSKRKSCAKFFWTSSKNRLNIGENFIVECLVMKYDTNNIFAKIIRQEIPCQRVYEDEKVLAFNDINPSAPVHVLVIPKGQYRSFADFAAEADPQEVADFFKKVGHVANMLGIADTGYRLITNHGKDSSQTVAHFHVHILGKKIMGELL